MSGRPTREQVTAWAGEVGGVGVRIGRHFARSAAHGQSFRSLALPRRYRSIGAMSSLPSHSRSVIARPPALA